MKLRTRLFLWVGIIFFAAFGVSLFFETYTTDKSLKESEEKLRNQILKLNEKRRETLEHYLHVSLSEDQAEIDSLLLRIAEDPKLGAALFIDSPSLSLTAPSHSAFIYKANQWIDFFQTTKDGALTSLLIPISFPMDIVHKVPIDDQISWIVLDEDKELDRPFIGVHLQANPKVKESAALAIEEMIDVDWGMTIFFDPLAIETWEKKPPFSQTELLEIDLPQFLLAVAHAADYLRGKTKEEMVQDIRSKSQTDLFSSVPFDEGIECLSEEGRALNERMIELLQRGDQAVMISALASLFPTKEFGASPFSKQAPKGVARFPKGAKAGHFVFTKEVFFHQTQFNDVLYHNTHPSSEKCDGVGSSLAVIFSQELQRIFVGNTLLLEGKKGKGFLTLGIDLDDLLQDLVLSISETALLVHQGKVTSAYRKGGEKIYKDFPFKSSMQEQKSGLVDWEGGSYYFLQMTPFSQMDLHFFILTPEKEAFALVNSIKEGSKEVIEDVSSNMRIIAVVALALVLMLLHRVARRITKPIVSLAKVTENVAAGRLEGIDLPTVPKGRHDEIASLCDSFGKMVLGLREKEKVKGVLNKVVSAEIAQEITKGSIQLGGEERKVTVFFADIREFTHMSASMAPHEVVDMLNTCMTKISHLIDEYGGVIDKYVGDEVMALFGAPLEKEDSALKAIQCALATIEVLNQWNEGRRKQNLEPVQMGFGIHTGTVLVGNMGAENRLNYTVIGSNVNFAARLCSAASPMEVLISKETLQETHVSENIEVEEHLPVEFKGYDEQFVVYIVKGPKHAG